MNLGTKIWYYDITALCFKFMIKCCKQTCIVICTMYNNIKSHLMALTLRTHKKNLHPKSLMEMMETGTKINRPYTRRRGCEVARHSVYYYAQISVLLRFVGEVLPRALRNTNENQGRF